MKADYYIVPELLPNKNRPENCYARFFENFQGASFLTFNYDSLAEVILLRMGQWYPQDGYGVDVKTQRADTCYSNPSSSLVLHLHGSFCSYATEFEYTSQPGEVVKWSTPLEIPIFNFHPHRISGLFAPHRGVAPGDSYRHPEERVVAPVPSKAEGLSEVFIHAVYSRAEQLLTESSTLVAIGYDFNEHDRISYGRLLERLSKNKNHKVVLVSPNAKMIENRLSKEYRSIDWLGLTTTFKEWVELKYQGLGE